MYLMNTNSQADRWNAIYSDKARKLPWINIPFPSEIETYLKALPRNVSLLVPGCGTGEIVEKLSTDGFTQIIGTDISSKAIERGRSNFPHLTLEPIPTEELVNQVRFLDSFVFDWLNLHQVPASALTVYMHSIGRISKSLCIAWIYEGDAEKQPSYVHEGEIYFHNPTTISELLLAQNLHLKMEGGFSFTSTGDTPTQHKAIFQIYERK
jgi:hypothetical protein